MNHSPNTEQRERELFETKMLRLDVLDDEGLERRADGSYIDEPAQAAWAAWQARATQAAPASPEPIMWVESEPSARLLDLREVIDGMCHTVMYHSKEPRTDNPVWPLYDRAPASPNTGAVPVAWRIWRSDRWCFAYSPNRDLHRSDAWEPLYLATPSPSKGGEADSAAEGLVPKEPGEFHSFQDWVNKAQSRLKSPDHKRAICIDAKNRRCCMGADFMRAQAENAFPVRYFWDFEERPLPLPTVTASNTINESN